MRSMVRHNSLVGCAAPPLTVAQLQISRRSRGFARAGVGRVSSVALVTALPAPPRKQLFRSPDGRLLRAPWTLPSC
ncbi:hypothetical protein DFH09DRAFT_1317689 [Mycena vulgaris]|nr:hypothetical protein DFH09DRAFT_1317689 [Mycena vulgaris]